jgi:hypothetical protein
VSGVEPPKPPRYEFADELGFADSRAALGLSDSEIDEHMWAIENMLLDDPILWSAPAPDDPDVRVAVSSATPHSPNPLRIAFWIDGTIIRRIKVGRR